MTTQAKTRVLLVENDLADQELTKLALKKNSRTQFEVTVASRLSDAERCLRRDEYDVILLDLGLPESSGLDTLDRVTRFSKQTPIVVLSDLNEEDAALASLERGAQDYLPKEGLAVGTLCRTIRYAIQRQSCRARR